ncbi:GAF domain-containing sensor histidine kinase [Spirilliplanes yamanashiensis]|uniref:Sensor-like histidine kinase SenX3 n=1 Tax=Spirilliplanes yamanashiensis TaxID=42233 RepID=A0A8J4DKA2_9ACTN|nr:ATP-binding protein [Spirilliplanes yamanashiensis]MDP9815586.1 signal transduction histidine kinase [Spirilliplanes yamanashiensis]GIJ03840.1 hypothetical protein Sya03_31920 [Spirilliplanes yamanashiensis]
MGAVPVDLDDPGRLAALNSYGLLDAPAGPELEAVLRVAAHVARVPTAVVNLIDDRRQCQITTVGFAGGDSDRDESMCAVSLTIGGLVVVPDARADPRFAANPWVTGLRADVRFYAAVPLVTADGYTLGTVCVFDTEPGDLDAVQRARLADLAEVVVGLFERRRQARVQEQLAAREEARTAFLDAVLDSVDVGIVAVDAGGHPTLFNRATRGWHGVDAVAAVGPAELARYYDLFEADGITRLAADRIPVIRALTEGAVVDAEMVIAPHGRPPVEVLCTGRVLTGPDGRPAGAVVAMTDVTAARAAQRVLHLVNAELTERTAQLDATVAELRRSNAELQGLAAVASHDLKAPLTVVRGYLEQFEDTYADRLDDAGRRWLTTMLAASDRMCQLIDSLLGHAKAGGDRLRAEPTDLGGLVDQVAVDLHRAVAAAGARVTVDGDLPTVVCDPVAIRQVLQNLVANAVKFAAPGRGPHVVCSAHPVDGGWEIAVADDGPGIPADRRTEVFGMFTRLPGDRSGHGIGLATCERIVHRHGGRIWVDETPGGGATFRFTLPGDL